MVLALFPSLKLPFYLWPVEKQVQALFLSLQLSFYLLFVGNVFYLCVKLLFCLCFVGNAFPNRRQIHFQVQPLVRLYDVHLFREFKCKFIAF